MTTAAKKSAASKTPKTPPAEEAVDSPQTPPPVAEPIDPYVDPIASVEALLSKANSGIAATIAAGLATVALAEEQRTANLIALLALGPDAWRDLYGSGAHEDAAQTAAELVAVRLGLARNV